MNNWFPSQIVSISYDLCTLQSISCICDLVISESRDSDICNVLRYDVVLREMNGHAKYQAFDIVCTTLDISLQKTSVTATNR